MNKPKVIVSKCIEFEKCRWNGLMISSPIVRQLKEYLDFIPVCPEVEIGLGVPREAIRLADREGKIELINSVNGKNYTAKMEAFAEDYLSDFSEIDGFILKNRSPSCGINNVKVYPGPGKVMLKHSRGVGIFAKHATEKFKLSAIEDEGRLLNLRIREHFLTKLYTIFRFNKLELKMKNLVDFHSKNKYLFMAYNQRELKNAGRIVANHKNNDIERIFNNYKQSLANILSRMPRQTSNINVLLHMFGYFSKNLNNEEKALFLDSLERYRNLQLPLVALTSLLRSWAARFHNNYLQEQYFLHPFPADLQSIFDSGKGRMYGE